MSRRKKAARFRRRPLFTACGRSVGNSSFLIPNCSRPSGAATRRHERVADGWPPSILPFQPSATIRSRRRVPNAVYI
jgi:hypothetical protein